jgi:hypothetical protein
VLLKGELFDQVLKGELSDQVPPRQGKAVENQITIHQEKNEISRPNTINAILVRTVAECRYGTVPLRIDQQSFIYAQCKHWRFIPVMQPRLQPNLQVV